MSSRRSVVCIVGGLLAWALAPAPGVAAADGPSFDCRTVEAGSIASLICADSGLSALDRQLAQVYADA
ncbi:MAG TPA: hypothetical protein PK163_10045, partial [Steroidobacteraceae bacterium]|nr:hypothetical protein [Steroidobacteraceae bacterium]